MRTLHREALALDQIFEPNGWTPLVPEALFAIALITCLGNRKDNVRSGCNRILCLVTASIGREYDELGRIFTSECTGLPLSSTSINSRGYKVRFSILYVERIVMIFVMSTTEISQRRRVGNLSTRGLREYTYSPSRSTGIPRSCSHGLSTNSTPMLCCPIETF